MVHCHTDFLFCGGYHLSVLVLSFGSTAPMACLREESFAALVLMGWEEQPLGRQRLQGRASDWEDNVLKEFLIAQARCMMNAPNK